MFNLSESKYLHEYPSRYCEGATKVSVRAVARIAYYAHGVNTIGPNSKYLYSIHTQHILSYN